MIGNYIERMYWNVDPKTGLKKKEWETCKVVTLGLENLLTTESLTRNKYIKTKYSNIRLKKIDTFILKELGLKEEIGQFFVINDFQVRLGVINEWIVWRDSKYITEVKTVNEIQNIFFLMYGVELEKNVATVPFF